MTVLMDAISRHADQKGDAIAIDGGKYGQMNWRELHTALERVCEALLAEFEPKDRPIAIELDHGIPAVLLDLALLEADIPALPLPAFFTAEQRSHALMESGASALMSGGTADFPASDPLFALSRLDCAAIGLFSGTAKISFTSGSTGTPKGICLSASHMLQVAQSVVDIVGGSHAGRHLALLPPGILLENVAGLYAVMLAGGTYVALPQAETGFANPFRPDVAQLLRVIGEQRITSLILVPEYLHGLVMAMEASGARFPALTLVAVGGARVSPELIARAVAVGLPVRQGYGLTECASVVALEGPDQSARGSAGCSLGHNRITCADDGEILIHGPVCLGSIGQPMPQGPYHTGDIGRIDQGGNLWIEGRKSNLIITSLGRNIAPEWVEGALLAQPEIAQAMVYGDGEATLSALIVPAGLDADIAAAVLRANATLPEYARIANTRRVAPFTPTNGLLTGNGRIKRAAISSLYLKGDMPLPFFDRLIAETAEAQSQLIAIPQLRAGLAGQIDRQTYISYLTQAYHHVSHTVPLLSAARAKLADNVQYAKALDEYIEEETGHEHWILSDIAAAGGDAQAAAASAPNPATAAMVNHAYDVIAHGNAAAMFGMVYVLEGTSIALATNGASAVQAALGLPPEAFTYLTSHGALDQEHMKFFAKLMNSIDDAQDQEAILAMARDIFRLFAGVFASIPMEQLDEAA
jgi:long-subunit acyl-CoA synthetase (AMP-forming)/pyrroloquinoline quinone (PQQ) biosynthesis protein C